MAGNRIQLDQDIRPVSEFRKNAARFIEQVQQEKRSIVLTQRGKSAAVLVDVAEYQQLLDKLEKMEDLLEADRQIEEGDVYSHADAQKQIRQHLNRWK